MMTTSGIDATANGVYTRPGKMWWSSVALALVVLILAPQGLDMALQYDLTSIFVFSLLAISMGFLWGGAGILSFGQTIFFGIGGYGYAIMAMNTGISTSGIIAGLLLGAAMAAALGYFMIYGRISDIYLSVITLVVTLIFEKAIRSTSGPSYVIGSVRLNGQNGIPGVPGLTLPFMDEALSIEGVFWLSGLVLLLTYVALRLTMSARFGRVLAGIRENERRMTLLGYDTRRYQWLAFVMAGCVASLAGVLFAVWGSFVGPEMFNLNQAALIVIWVIVGGRTTLVGPIIGTAIVQYLSKWLGTTGLSQVATMMGLVLITFVLLFPKGILPTVASFTDMCMKLRSRRADHA